MKFSSLIPHPFRRQTPLETAAAELIEAELARLQAQSAQEYAAAIVTYRGQQIRRLREFVATAAASSGAEVVR